MLSVSFSQVVERCLQIIIWVVGGLNHFLCYSKKTHLTLGTYSKLDESSLDSVDLEETPNSSDSILEAEPG